MRNDKNLLELKVCPNCQGDWLEEVFDPEKSSYSILCKSCNFQSEGSIILEEAKVIWNEIFNPELSYITEEIEYFEKKIESKRTEIEILEDEIYDIEAEIEELKKLLE